MVSNFKEVIAEADGSEEFQQILWVLIQEKQENAPPQPGKGPQRQANIWIERILLVSGLTLLAIYGVARLESLFRSRAALHQFAAMAPLSSEAGDGIAEDADPSGIDFSQWDEHRVHAYKESLNRKSGAPLGVLNIPKIGLEVPVLDGTDALTLNHAVGRISGTARPGEPGNIGIAGHRDGFFRGLKDIALGDTIDLQRRNGTDTYIVDAIDIVSPKQVDVLRPGSVPSLTLVTCYPFYFVGSAPQRYIVHASRTEFEPQKYKPTEQGSLILANQK
jgi:sortase A